MHAIYRIFEYSADQNKQYIKSHDTINLRGSKTSNLKKAGWFTAALGSITLAWVAQLTLYDMITWGKDITRIFFSSRTDEYMFPTLGIDMRVIHYFLIGLTLLLGSVGLLRIRRCPHHFGYYASQPKKDVMPKTCLFCKKVAECVSGTPQKQKTPTKPAAKKEKDPPECPHQFGYLSSLPNDQAVPQECTKCQKLVECRNLV
jgi:hypothetical protein